MDKGRTIYQKKDTLFQQLLDGCATGDVIETKSGRSKVLQFQAAEWLEPVTPEGDDDE
jgi:hypothetical protein